MDFEKILSMRQSTRKFQEKQITEEQLEKILNAANRAPVGSNKYEDIHITVVQDQKILLKLCEAAWERFSRLQKLEDVAGDTIDKTVPQEKRNNLFYGAPTVIFVSHKKQDLQPGIEWANVTSIINQMHLETINLGLSSVYMWGALESMRMIPERDNTKVLNLPNGYEPLIALAIGYPFKELAEHPIKHEIIKLNRI